MSDNNDDGPIYSALSGKILGGRPCNYGES
jgi:hypothetical protein